MYQLVVFDMAGTTVHDRDFVHQALISAMKVYGFEVDRSEANAVMGYPKPLAIRQMLERRCADVALVEPIHQRFLEEMTRFYATDPAVKPADYAEEALLRLRAAGVRVALNTGFSRNIAETIIRRLGWEERLDAWVASDMVEQGRPYPHMIRYLMEKTGVKDPASVAKVGDTPVDIEEGRNAGVGLVLAVTNGAYEAEELSPYGPHHLVADLREALTYLLPNE
ncbi:MAG: HAD hydrolase-like protein [Saprospiraceae bacterium]|nr:HAD hydrolase-like protein [Saprospiraceae bacterium]MDW8229204.1 HAD hydrolase-like protein [Saprospiraceae bacterium]